MMLIDYCWFFSLPIAAGCQPDAPDLFVKITLEDGCHEFVEDSPLRFDEHHTGAERGCAAIMSEFVAMTLLVLCYILPLLCLALYLGGKSESWFLLLVGIGIPIIFMCILGMPVRREAPEDRYKNTYESHCFFGFSVNGARFSFYNYAKPLASFLKGAMNPTDFRRTYGQWFVDQKGNDPSRGVNFGGNTTMIYDWEGCRERLESMGERLRTGSAKRESELALVVMNNLMFPEVGRFALGYGTEDHALVRPFLASLFDGGRGRTWDQEKLRRLFASYLGKVEKFDHNLVTRNALDIFSPFRSKTLVTQLCLKVFHQIVFGAPLSDDDAVELAALQSTQLIPAVCPARVTRSFAMWSLLAGPARAQCAKWIGRYKALFRKLRASSGSGIKWPEQGADEGEDDARLTLLASAFLDTMTQAGGRSVPLAIDLALGYILTKNKPPALAVECDAGLDEFTKDPDKIRTLIIECMRFHPPVTTIPTWVHGTKTGDPKWKHELICLDRACADKKVFRDPDKFRMDRDQTKSMAWGEFAYVNGQVEDPHSYGCPGKELSIDMTVAFVLAFFESGPWEPAPGTLDIKLNYYGTVNGITCRKVKKG